ncbi:5'-nucleotidase domain-containing protein 1 [Condylostylus longicornis]|uniref:5'-nucleotidase domain-containing protein 1 n=1 Tax=Condylostylus longicornis TaxID=2530218 RepID=UPI00244DA524|nr:5'-nucleotidase domain-containing protein 1 [Condylostylus longicornis]
MFAQRITQVLSYNLDKNLLFSLLRKEILQKNLQKFVIKSLTLNSMTLVASKATMYHHPFIAKTKSILELKLPITKTIIKIFRKSTVTSNCYRVFSISCGYQNAYISKNYNCNFLSSNSPKPFLGYSLNKRYYSRYAASTIMPHNTFNLNNYDIIGFDLDGTLLRYNLDAMVTMEYNIIAKYLVEHKNYPKELLKPIDNDIDFLQKGLILDAVRGNILKLSFDGVILKATHGTKLLSENDIKRIYGEEKKWDLTTQYINDPLSAWNGPNADKLRALLDYFDMPASLVMARAVDLINEKHNSSHLSEYKIWPDILDALVFMYKRENFASGFGEYFEELKNNPNKYIHKSDPYIIKWLQELKKTKAIFLLTGSNIDFANLTASHALGHNWRNLFDVIIAFAKKPGFFTMNRPFYSFQGGEEDQIIPDNSIKMGNVYAQGNWKSVEKLLAKKFGKTIKKPRSLYIGDNLIQDVYTPSKYCELDTVSLVEELEEHECQDGYAFKKVIQSSLWGSYFSIDNKPTYWSEVIKKHSKMCLPTIEHLCQHPLNYEYQCSSTITE